MSSFSAVHPQFGKIAYDGQTVTVENDSLSAILNRLMQPEEYEQLRIVGYNPDLIGRLLSILQEMGLEGALSGMEVHFDPEPEPVPGEPPRIY